MRTTTLAANLAWWLANAPGYARFRMALHKPKDAQEKLLFQTLKANRHTAFGREHDFGEISSVEQWRKRVPIRDYDELLPWLSRMFQGEPNVLLCPDKEHHQTLFEPSSGSSAAAKLIPYNKALKNQFNAGIEPWLFDMYRQFPKLVGGPAYWSISPLTQGRRQTPGGTPIGFEADSEYLGGLQASLAARLMAAPQALKSVRDMDVFRYLTLLSLLRCSDLRLISVWSPSFLSLLLKPLASWWEQLLSDISTGQVNPPASTPGVPLTSFTGPASPRRANFLRQLGPDTPGRLWPQLALLSCWADAHAATQIEPLKVLFPNLPIQSKGLLATEAFISLPFQGLHPAAVNSHYIELVDEQGEAKGLHEVRKGGRYETVVTTAGGLYRYRLNDIVEVTGHLEHTPTLRFVGKADKSSDRCGEKLTEAFVSAVIKDLLQRFNLDNPFCMLAPDPPASGVEGYTLYLGTSTAPPELALALEEQLKENFHYEWCARLGQLQPPRVFHVQADAWANWYEACQTRGQRLGDIKATALDHRDGWSELLAGHYSDASRDTLSVK